MDSHRRFKEAEDVKRVLEELKSCNGQLAQELAAIENELTSMKGNFKSMVDLSGEFDTTSKPPPTFRLVVEELEKDLRRSEVKQTTHLLTGGRVHEAAPPGQTPAPTATNAPRHN